MIPRAGVHVSDSIRHTIKACDAVFGTSSASFPTPVIPSFSRLMARWLGHAQELYVQSKQGREAQQVRQYRRAVMNVRTHSFNPAPIQSSTRTQHKQQASIAMEPDGEFSLGGALFDWPVADGHAQPQLLVPDAWLLVFKDQHACPGVLSGIFTSCRAGRDWALSTADHVALTLDCTTPVSTIPSTTDSSSLLATAPTAPSNSTNSTSTNSNSVHAPAPPTAATAPPAAPISDSAADQLYSAWSSRADVLRQTLAARGALGVAVHVMHDSTPASEYACAVGVPALLCDSGAMITALSVRQTDPHNPRLTDFLPPATDLLHTLTPILGPHLTTLSLNPCTCTIPPPDALPNLRHLSITVLQNSEDTEDSVHSLVPHLAQIESLAVTDDRDYIDWEELEPAQPSQSLTTFTHSGSVTDEVLGFLLDHAPKLKVVHMEAIGVVSDFGDDLWPIQDLIITEKYTFDANRFIWLPCCWEQVAIRVDALDLRGVTDEVRVSQYSYVIVRAVPGKQDRKQYALLQ